MEFEEVVLAFVGGSVGFLADGSCLDLVVSENSESQL